MMTEVKTNRIEIEKVWHALAANNLRGEWADSMLRSLLMVLTGGCSEDVVLILLPEELKVWQEYAAKALL